MPSVSIILPTRNRAKTLKRAVDSVLNQSFADFELVIVNDGSTDHSKQLLDDACEDERVRCYHFEHSRGAGAARNCGIENSTSPFVAFQDSDDEWYPDKLSMQLESINKSGAGVVYSHMLRIDCAGNESTFLAPDNVFEDIYDTDLYKYHVENIGIQSCLIKRECLIESGLFNERMPALEDLELFIRLGKVCTFQRIDLTLVKYHEGEGLSSNINAQIQARKMLFQMYKQELGCNKKAVAIEMMRINELERRGAQSNHPKDGTP